MSKHNHTLSINRDIYIWNFLKLRINWPFFSNIIYIYIESIDKSNRKHNFFPENYTRTCYICLWHEILLENDTYDRINFYLICLV